MSWMVTTNHCNVISINKKQDEFKELLMSIDRKLDMLLSNQGGSKENSAANEDSTVFSMADDAAFTEFENKASKGEINRASLVIFFISKFFYF